MTALQCVGLSGSLSLESASHPDTQPRDVHRHSPHRPTCPWPDIIRAERCERNSSKPSRTTSCYGITLGSPFVQPECVAHPESVGTADESQSSRVVKPLVQAIGPAATIRGGARDPVLARVVSGEALNSLMQSMPSGLRSLAAFQEGLHLIYDAGKCGSTDDRVA